MKAKLNSLKTSIKKSDGLLTAKGKLVDTAEVHGLVIGVGAAAVGGLPMLGGFYTLAMAGKKKIGKMPGQIQDAAREIAYTAAGFGLAETIQRVILPSLT